MGKSIVLKKTAVLLLLLTVLGIGSALRFHRLRDIGPFIADEADYNLESKYLFSLARGIRDSLELRAREARTSEDLWRLEEQRTAVNDQMMGQKPKYGRPGQIVLMAISMALLGPEPYIGPLVSATSGAFTLLIVFFLARSLYGTSAGLMASALLAVSGIHVTYCRTGLTEALNTLLVLSALLTYTRIRGGDGSREKRLLALTGLLLGAGFIVHYRTALMIVLFAILEILRPREELTEGRWPRFKRLLSFTAWSAAPVVLWEVPYYLAVLALHRLKIIPPFLTYFEQLLANIFMVAHANFASTAKVFDFSNFLTYPYLFWKMEGPAVTALLPAALALALRVRRSGDTQLLTLFALPLLFYSLAQPNARYTVLAAALAAVLCARLIVGLWRIRPVAAIVLTATLLLSGLHASIRAADLKSDGYAKVESFLERSGAEKRIATYLNVAQVYGGVRNVAPLSRWPESLDDLSRLHDEGYRYYVVDFFKDGVKLLIERYGISDPKVLDRVERHIGLIDRIEEETVQVFACDNPPVSALNNIFEVNHNFRKSLEYLNLVRRGESSLNRIRVYDISEFLAGVPAQADTPPGRNSP